MNPDDTITILSIPISAAKTRGERTGGTEAQRKALSLTITLPDLNLANGERLTCITALEQTGSIGEAAQLLGITRHALSRRITKHRIDWPRRTVTSDLTTSG